MREYLGLDDRDVPLPGGQRLRCHISGGRAGGQQQQADSDDSGPLAEHPPIGDEKVRAGGRGDRTRISDGCRHVQHLDADDRADHVSHDRREASAQIEAKKATKRARSIVLAIPPRPALMPDEVVQHRGFDG